MQNMLREHAKIIYETAIRENMSNEAVKRAVYEQIEKNTPNFVNKVGKLSLISIGKAGWEMAKSAYEILKDKIDVGVVITKYSHIPKEYRRTNDAKENCSLVGRLGKIELHEAGHPVVDFNSVSATKRCLELLKDFGENDTVLLLISGGGSALFEDVSCPLEKVRDLNKKLLECGADINEINAVRKHISNVKGGRFAEYVYPASVFAVALSDVVGNDLSTIASGPACADKTRVEDCLYILEKYGISLDEEMMSLIKRETPKEITNAVHTVSGSVSLLCESAKKAAESLGYFARVGHDGVKSEDWKLADLIGKNIRADKDTFVPLAIIYGGEISVKVKGKGKGGRNQHLALMCAEQIKGYKNAAVFCVGSDGTDGPTDAAGGYVDGNSYENMVLAGISPEECLKNNDSYSGLSAIDGLIFTGPTGTNVNDLYVLLIWKNGKWE